MPECRRLSVFEKAVAPADLRSRAQSDDRRQDMQIGIAGRASYMGDKESSPFWLGRSHQLPLVQAQQTPTSVSTQGSKQVTES